MSAQSCSNASKGSKDDDPERQNSNVFQEKKGFFDSKPSNPVIGNLNQTKFMSLDS